MLDKYRWKKRILIIFSKDNNFIEKQIKLLNQVKSGLIKRDMILFGFQEDQPPFSIEKTINIESLQKSLSVKDNTLVLLGKDGYMKAIWKKTVDPKTIFDIVDAMPMRQREMRNRGK